VYKGGVPVLIGIDDGGDLSHTCVLVWGSFSLQRQSEVEGGGGADEGAGGEVGARSEDEEGVTGGWLVLGLHGSRELPSCTVKSPDAGPALEATSMVMFIVDGAVCLTKATPDPSVTDEVISIPVAASLSVTLSETGSMDVTVILNASPD